MPDNPRNFFDTLEKVLLRCWIFGVAFLFLAFAVIFPAGRFINDIQRRMFGLPPHEFDVIFDCCFGALKLFVLTLFFIPWLVI